MGVGVAVRYKRVCAVVRLLLILSDTSAWNALNWRKREQVSLLRTVTHRFLHAWPRDQVMMCSFQCCH